jgi:hypothetical protein
MRRVFFGLAGLMLLAVLAQLCFAALGAFDQSQAGTLFALHTKTGTVAIPLLSALATVAAAVARAPRRLVALTLAPAGLVAVQVLIIILSGILDKGALTLGALALLGLHELNGLVLMLVTVLVFTRARLFAAATAPARSEAAPAA